MQRLDVYLVELNKFANRSQATRAIKENRVIVNGKKAAKAGELVDEKSIIEVLEQTHTFVSRGGLKLQGAIEDFGIDINEVVALDIGSSTGGFCDCLLQNGAKQVIAVDIGTNQLHEKLRNDSRIKLFENTDIREFVCKGKDAPTFACGDLSFISLEKIIPAIARNASINCVVLLIKPQFECGKEVATKYNGVIKDFKEHKKALVNVLTCLQNHGFGIINLVPSSIKGGSGNIEYVVLAQKNAPKAQFESLIKIAISKAKQKYKKGADNV